MSIHEYATSILSIVLGLGVANLLSGFAWMTRNPSNNTYFYVFGMWNLSLLLATLGMWWAIWTLFKGLQELTFWYFLPTFIGSALLYLASKILVPHSGNVTIRLDETFPSIAKPLYVCVALIFFAGGVVNPPTNFDLEAVLGFGLIGIVLAGLFAKSPFHHACIALGWLLVFLIQQSVQPSIL